MMVGTGQEGLGRGDIPSDDEMAGPEICLSVKEPDSGRSPIISDRKKKNVIVDERGYHHFLQGEEGGGRVCKGEQDGRDQDSVIRFGNEEGFFIE